VLGKPLLEYQLERLAEVKYSFLTVVATTVNVEDDPIVALCEQLQVPYYRGSEEDVLARYYEAAREHMAEAVVRVTSDCPLIDPEIVDRTIAFYLDHWQDFDYVANNLERTYPRGLDCEVFSMKALECAQAEAVQPSHREHVTPFFYRQPQRFRLGQVKSPIDYSFHRWTVDTEEDFRLIALMIEALYPDRPHFRLDDCLKLLERHPDWIKINAEVKQKPVL